MLILVAKYMYNSILYELINLIISISCKIPNYSTVQDTVF